METEKEINNTMKHAISGKDDFSNSTEHDNLKRDIEYIGDALKAIDKAIGSLNLRLTALEQKEADRIQIAELSETVKKIYDYIIPNNNW